MPGRSEPGRFAERSPAELAARRRIATENARAAGLQADDARWILAVRVSREIEGGRAAVLPPDKRARLLTLGARMGLRPFDTNLVIAIVQDSARSGEERFGPDQQATGLGPAAERRLELVRAPRPTSGALGGRWSYGVVVIVGVAVACAWVYLLIRWLR